ncbi:MAG: DUF58 domain-containing protein [Bacteroidales bacterium]|nr:DUF58 domain-containing protein [Bacteroidales bacterium]
MDQSHIDRYKSLDFFARQVVEGFITGRHKSPFHGFSVEFSDYRQYNPGESTRNIDYRLYGRTDRLYVKQFEEETNLRCQILIDQSSSMLYPLECHGDIEHPNKLTFAIYAAAVLVELLHRQRDAFGLTLFSQGPDLNTPCRSSRLHQQYLLSELEKLLAPNPTNKSVNQPLSNSKTPPLTTNIPASIHLMAEQLHRRSLVVLFTDALVHPDQQEPLFDALRHLRHNKHEVILFHTYDLPHEVNLDFDTRPHLFIDLETHRQLRLQPSQVADAYRRQMTSLFDSLRLRAMQYRIDYVPIDVTQGFHQLLLPFLLKRSKSH